MGSTPNDQGMLVMDGWPGGINNRIRETEQKVQRDGVSVPSSQFLREALNVDLTAEGHPIRRKGAQLIESGFAHSLWADDGIGVLCVVVDGMLYFCPEADTLTAWDGVQVNRYNPVSYTVLDESIYWSNGKELGEFDLGSKTARNWGIPAGPSAGGLGAAPDDNGMPESYLIAYTYVDHFGREGGAGEIGMTASPSGSARVPSYASAVRVYASDLNSEILYYRGSITGSGGSIGVEGRPGEVLQNAYLQPPKAGQLVTTHSGRIYIARNQTVYFTEPMGPHLTRPGNGIFMFPEYIDLLASSGDGVYVGHKQGVSFLAGTDPYDVQQRHVSSYAPVPHTMAMLPGKWFNQSVDKLPVWWSVDGVLVVGLPNGQLKELTRDRLAVPTYAAGAVSLREQDGQVHVVSSLRSSDGVNNMGATDSVVATVRTNNIVLNG